MAKGNAPVGFMRCASAGCWAEVIEVVSLIALCRHHRDHLAAHFGSWAHAEGGLISAYKSIVYYVTWDKGETVKIGTTTNPKSRFHAYTAKRGRPVDLLAAHPGSYDEEKSIHRRHSHLRVVNERELFKNGPDLLEHISNVKRAWPNWKQIVNELAWQKAGRRGRQLNAVLNAR
jgi:hypothetical protein